MLDAKKTIPFSVIQKLFEAGKGRLKSRGAESWWGCFDSGSDSGLLIDSDFGSDSGFDTKYAINNT